MVACPQNGTSHRGEKYRTRHAPPSGAAKAVSENPTSAAIACIFDADGNSSPIQTPAGLPPLWPSENAAMRRTVMPVILFPVHLLPPIVADGRLRYHSATAKQECPSSSGAARHTATFHDSVAGGSKRHIQ